LAEITPFRGIRYAVRDDELVSVLAPPYDVISPARQKALYDRDPRNIVRVVLNATPGDGAYTDAALHFRRLLAEGALREDRTALHYLLEQVFLLDGKTRSRWGLLTRFRAEGPEHGRILPHERTRREAKEDRFKLLEATRANFSPIFLMFEDRGAFSELASAGREGPPISAYTDDDGVQHRLFEISNREEQEAFEALLSEGKAYIADGHHRYSTALRYRDAHGPEGAWTFGYFTPLGGEGLAVLPYHRLLVGADSSEPVANALSGHFAIQKIPALRGLGEALGRSKARYAFGLFDRNAAWLAESGPSFEELLPPDAPPSLRALDSFALHKGAIGRLLGIGEDRVEYFHSLQDLEASVSSGQGVAVLMRSTSIRQIVDVSEAGESMPPKSTFFFPKLPSGLVIHALPHGSPQVR
jgi:uncharacterized protein (DUF1015 family)